MKNIILGLVSVVFIAVTVGCGVQTDVKPDTFTTVPANERMKEIGARNVPEVRAIFAGNEATGLQPLALGPNLFDNSGFENGLAGWTGCEAGAVQPSSDAFAGSAALQLNPNNCFYRAAEAPINLNSIGQELVLSCYIKVRNGAGWTGMGMSFDDATFTSLQDSPKVVATSGEYVRYETRGTAPANTKYLSMWIYSENDVVVDDCSLAVDSDGPVIPPLPPLQNLLENSNFRILNADDKPVDWTKGCNGTWEIETGPRGNELKITDEACVDQSLSSEEAISLSGRKYTYSCYVKNSSAYASITIFLNGQASSQVIPVSSEYQEVALTGEAPLNTSNAFVSIYSEGTTVVDSCNLIRNDVVIPPNPDNLLINGAFESVNSSNEPTAWVRGCGGSWSSIAGRSGKGLQVSGGACVDQYLNDSVAASLSGKTFSYSCYVRGSVNYASMSVFLNGIASSTVIPASRSFQRIEVTGSAPISAESAFVSLYSEGNIEVDDCVLSISEPNSSPELRAYQENLNKWQAQNIDDYEFVFQRICFCIRDVTRPVRISVQDGAKVSIRKVETYKDVTEDQYNFYLSVDEMFALIKDAIDENAVTIRVDYDGEFGYPTSIFIDYDEMLADEEVSIQASYLTSTPNGPTPLPTECSAYSTDSYEYNSGSSGNEAFTTLQFLPTQTIVETVNVCVRSQHTNGCVEAVDIASSFEDGAFKLVKTILPIQTFVACTAAITPYAKVVELDVAGLEPTTYQVAYFSSNDARNPQVQTSFELEASSFASCLREGVTEQTVVSTSMSTNAAGQMVISKLTVLEKLNAINATCSGSTIEDANGTEIRFYNLIGCWGVLPPDGEQQLAQQDAEIAALEEEFTVITLTCNLGGIPFP